METILYQDNLGTIIHSHFFPDFMPKALYFINKYEPTRLQLYQWSFGTKTYSKFWYFAFFGQNLEIKCVCFINPKLNPNNHYRLVEAPWF